MIKKRIKTFLNQCFCEFCHVVNLLQKIIHYSGWGRISTRLVSPIETTPLHNQTVHFIDFTTKQVQLMSVGNYKWVTSRSGILNGIMDLNHS